VGAWESLLRLRDRPPPWPSGARADAQHDCHLSRDGQHRLEVEAADRLAHVGETDRLGQSTMIWDGSRKPFSGVGSMSIRVLMSTLRSDVIGRIVA
jgi:hypothetical protein